ncbi:MAG: hypothetical protein WA139_02960 [Candidatus Aenigmatarchaeota archaeon]
MTKPQKLRKILAEAYRELGYGNHKLEIFGINGLPVASFGVKRDDMLTVSGNMSAFYDDAKIAARRLLHQDAESVAIEIEDGSRYYAKMIGGNNILGIVSDLKSFDAVKTVLNKYSSKFIGIL